MRGYKTYSGLSVKTGNPTKTIQFRLPCGSRLKVRVTLDFYYQENSYDIHAYFCEKGYRTFNPVDPKDYPDQCKEVLNELWQSLKPEWEQGQ